MSEVNALLADRSRAIAPIAIVIACLKVTPGERPRVHFRSLADGKLVASLHPARPGIRALFRELRDSIRMSIHTLKIFISRTADSYAVDLGDVVGSSEADL
jgi:hypothetical protein